MLVWHVLCCDDRRLRPKATLRLDIYDPHPLHERTEYGILEMS